MKSLYAKILVWSVATVLFSLVAFYQITVSVSRNAQRRGGSFGHLRAMQLEDARAAYESGGTKRLDAYMQRLKTFFPSEHYLTDAEGRDLLDGQDRAAMFLKRRPPFWSGWFHSTNLVTFDEESTDKKYHFIAAVPPPPRAVLADFLPYYFLIVVVVAVFGYVLAVHLASPLRALRKAVDRFGRGDLAARVNSRRTDEIGGLSKSFDQMAERIQTLLTAERRLLQDISHELRSPLARLSFGVELARTAEDRAAAVARIKKEVDRLTSLVGGLLQVTRAEGDPAQRNTEEVDLKALLEELVEDCSIEAEKRDCHVHLQAHGSVLLHGDRELLRRAIENVLRNAIRYSPEGQTIEVSLEPNPQGTSISIRDYGTGVPDDMLTEIFKPFFRVGQARDAASGGVGLGLAIAQRAVALHQGKMAARNMTPGLLVSVELPLDHAA